MTDQILICLIVKHSYSYDVILMRLCLIIYHNTIINKIGNDLLKLKYVDILKLLQLIHFKIHKHTSNEINSYQKKYIKNEKKQIANVKNFIIIMIWYTI